MKGMEFLSLGEMGGEIKERHNGVPFGPNYPAMYPHNILAARTSYVTETIFKEFIFLSSQ
jgi:hypothetical protein